MGLPDIVLRFRTIELDLRTLNVHVRLTQRERIDVGFRVQVRQAVVDEAMRGLVRPHGIENIEKLRVLRKSPIID
jgi:hypothetical protein